MKIKNSNKKGMAMVEILVACSILVAAFISVMASAQRSIYLVRQGLHQTQAAFLIEEGAEAVRVFRDSSWSNISSLTPSTNYYPSFSGGTWTLTEMVNSVGIFSRKVTVSNVYRNASEDIASSGTLDAGTKLITVTVSWQEGTKAVSKSISFYVSDIFS